MNILAIGAHFDDIEIGCGGTLARHVAQGDRVWAYVATKSGYTSPDHVVIRSNEVARMEGEAAMKILGVALICGSFNTLEVAFSNQLTSEILTIIEKNKIDRVYTHWAGDIHRDHSIVARASLHSCRHVQRLLMYRSNWYHSDRQFKGNYYVDISGFVDVKRACIEAHKSEMERTRSAWIPFFTNEAKNDGQRIGVRYAEVFEVVKWLEQ